MITKEDIFLRIRQVLTEVFEFEEKAIVPNAHIYRDLGLDSFDSIDLAVNLGADTGIKIKEEDLRSIRTVHDIVEVVYKKVNEGSLLEN